MNYCYNFKNSTKFYFLRYFLLVCFKVTGNASNFFLSCQVLIETIRFEIIIYLDIKQCLLMLTAKVEFTKTSTL